MKKDGTAKKSGALRHIKRIFRVLGVLFLLFLMALCIILIYQRIAGQEANLFGYRFFEVQSASMEPAIMTGDTIITKDIGNPQNLKIGDVVVFKNDEVWNNVGKPEMKGNYIVHRIVEIRRGADGNIVAVTTLGDNNHGQKDPETNIAAVEALFLTKADSEFFNFIRSPLGIIAIIAALIAIFMALRLGNALYLKAKEKKDAKRIDVGDASDTVSEKKPDALDENGAPSEESSAEGEDGKIAETDALPVTTENKKKATQKKAQGKVRRKSVRKTEEENEDGAQEEKESKEEV